jgi:hypothetical protein
MSLVHRCGWCAGRGFESQAGGAEKCGACDGSGWSPVCGHLAPTKAYPRGRAFRFYPGINVLVLNRKGKVETYTFAEFTPDALLEVGFARAFHCTKHSTQERYDLLVSRAGISCDCAAKAWGSSWRANDRARREGGDTYLTCGCAHSDVLSFALQNELFDLPQLEEAV